MSTVDASDHDVVLAIDLGSGGPKTAFVSLGGDVLDHVHTRVEMSTLPDDGVVEDPNEWWSAICAGTNELVARGSLDPDQIVAVAVTGQWGSTVPVDRHGQAVGDCIMWLDQRARALARAQLGGKLAVDGYRPRLGIEFVRRAGGAPNPQGNDPLGHRLWIEQREPDRYRRTAAFVEPIDYVNLRFTGKLHATQATMLASWLTDNRILDATSYDPLLVRFSGTDPGRLPPLLPIRSIVGPITEDAAASTGVPAGIPVVTGLPDLHTAALGSGAIDDYHGHLAISTSAWVGCHTPDKRTSLQHQMATVPAALPDRYILANNHDCGGVSLEWLRDRVIAPDDLLGAGDAPALRLLDELAASVPPGANGVMFAPWLKGGRTPVSDTSMRASFLNLGIDSGRAEMVRAVLEGISHQLRWILESAEKVLKHPIHDLRVIGGGAQSDLWCQIQSDVLNRPVHRVTDPLLVNVRGAALFAGVVTGRIDQRSITSRATIDRVFRPDPDAADLLGQRHEQFLGLAKSQQGFHHALNRVRRSR
ncbi:MAG: carbohydrate kinase [Actinobacteria bacterium]|nr:carbohydrate kinase [Actinomycetota bacterium]